MKTTRYATNWWRIRTAGMLMAVAVVSSPFLLSAQTSQSVSTEDLLVLLRGLEEATAILEYNVQYSEHRAPSDARVNFAEPLQKWENVGEPTGVQKTAHFLLEYGTGRVNFTREGTGYAWVPETKERFLSPHKRSLAFDGATRTEINWTRPDQGGPGAGIISVQPLEANKELSSFETGMDVMLPFYRGVGLRRHLSSDKVDPSSIRGELRSDGILEVSYVDAAKGQRFGLSIDLQKNGAILQETYYANASPDAVVVRTENTWEKDSQGNWVPRSSLAVVGSLGPIIHKLSFADVKRNHLEPKPEMFRIEFPPGTDVVDRRTEINYVVGASPQELVKDITTTLVETRQMSGRPQPADANTALPGHELGREPAEAGAAAVTGGAPEPGRAEDEDVPAVVSPAARRRGLWMMLTGAMLMAVILSAGAWCRKKIGRTGRGATLLLLAAVAACAAWPGAKARAEAASERPFYGWAAPGPGERPIPIYQCGLAATMYTLQYFGHTYRSEDLIALMVPSAQGISLADMMRAMQVHGLEVDPRAGVRAGDLLASLADDRIAILPTTATAGEKGHFYVIVRGRGSSFLLVDAGRSVKAQSVPEMQERLRANQGVVAFVSVRQQGQDARAVGIDPEEANLGEIHSTDAQATAKFTIRNGSARCVFVTHVAPACSCTASGWKGGLLSPGQEVAIDISIKPTALRVGKFKKSVAFTFADGSSQEVYMAGECLGPEESQGIRVAPTEVYFDFGETPRHQTKQLKVFGRGPVRVALNEADWASAEVIRQPTNQPGTIEVTADPNRTTSTRDAGVLQVWVVDGEPRLSIPIHAVRSKPYQVEGRIVTLARGKGPQAGAFVFRKGTANVGAIQVEPVAGGLDGIQLQPVQNEQESRLQVNVTGAGPLASGLHPIDLLIRVGDAGGRPYSERVYIMVR